jgi:hypothetical protein
VKATAGGRRTLKKGAGGKNIPSKMANAVSFADSDSDLDAY